MYTRTAHTHTHTHTHIHTHAHTFYKNIVYQNQKIEIC